MSIQSLTPSAQAARPLDPIPSAPLRPAEEKRLARDLSPAIAWPTLAMAAALPLAMAGIAWLGLVRSLPLWACAIVLSVLSYACYTLVHESIHGNLAPGRPKLRWINTAVGWLGALGLGFNWPMLMRTHLLHHAHTNSEADPDVWVKGGFAALIGKAIYVGLVGTLPLFVLRTVSPKDYRMATEGLEGSERAQAEAVTLLVLMLLAASIATGRFIDWLLLLFVPTRVANVLLAIFFQWLPHHPFDSTERYLNTRISLWPGAGVLTLQQNLHLVHHLWPSVPFYNYGRFYRLLRPTLTAKGSRIEGLRVGVRAGGLVQRGGGA